MIDPYIMNSMNNSCQPLITYKSSVSEDYEKIKIMKDIKLFLTPHSPFLPQRN